ncbi:MAG: mitomycin antibiotics/polyketide fumonisin biosynthesis protein [Candidatus Latescibacteria bacterium]|nr:mitomycin antibiotics/polyketide fumonisin biosynthesis protein [Candidatus Latescibacterota bacterium]
MTDLETQQYLFDVQGYLVLEEVLDTDQVAALNQLLDNHLPPAKPPRFGAAPAGSGFLDWGQPFIDLLDQDPVMAALRFRLGDCFRLDRLYGMCMEAGMGPGGLHCDYGPTAPTSGAQPGQYYPQRDNQILNGFVVVAWNLTDTGQESGGFCCIPGSHKSNFKLPHSIATNPENASCVITPQAPAGSVILFSEALTHATARWHGPHQRRTLLYKYCVSHMVWTNRRVQAPTGLTQRQQILFAEPGDPHRFFPSLFADGEAASAP